MDSLADLYLYGGASRKNELVNSGKNIIIGDCTSTHNLASAIAKDNRKCLELSDSSVSGGS